MNFATFKPFHVATGRHMRNLQPAGPSDCHRQSSDKRSRSHAAGLHTLVLWYSVLRSATQLHKVGISCRENALEIWRARFQCSSRPVDSHSEARETIIAAFTGPYQSITISFCMCRDRDAEGVERDETVIET